MAWRSIVDIPRDGQVIAVIYRDVPCGAVDPIVRCEALMLGVDEDGVEQWYCAGDWRGLYDSAESLDPQIIGWFPLPQVAEWLSAEAPQFAPHTGGAREP